MSDKSTAPPPERIWIDNAEPDSRLWWYNKPGAIDSDPIEYRRANPSPDVVTPSEGRHYRKFLSQYDECGECGNAACRGIELFPMRINGETFARCWECLDLVETSKAKAQLDLTWAEHQRDGGTHTEWHAPCGCAYHPNPFPHVHPCSDAHKRLDLHSLANPDVVAAARRAAHKIAVKLFAEIFHPAGQGGISVEMEKEFAEIITTELGNGQRVDAERSPNEV